MLITSALRVAATTIAAAPNDWAEGTPGKDNGATRDYYNRAGQLEWKHKLGDWRDANNIAQGGRTGDAPSRRRTFASATWTG